MSDRGPMAADHHAQKQRIFACQRYRCLGCDRRRKYNELTRHHVILRVRGGADTDENICLLCETCHANCHNWDKRVQHDALRPVLLAFGYGSVARGELYAMYRQYGVFGVNIWTMRRREIGAELMRWSDDGGAVV